MFRFIVFAVVLVSTAWCGCKEDLATNTEFMNCTMSLGKMVAGAMQGVDKSDMVAQSKHMFKAICSTQGRNDFNCMMKFVGGCPDMMQSPSVSSMFGPDMNMTQMMNQGGLDAACSLMTGDCIKVMDCFNLVPKDMKDPFEGVDMSTIGATPYSQFQIMSSVLCGPMHDMMACMVKKLKDPSCAEAVKYAEKQAAPMIQKYQSKGLKIASLNDTEKFTMDLCPAMPRGFSTNDCVKKSLKTAEFSGCFGNMMKKYDLHEKQDCKVYFDAKKCIETHLMECGNYAIAFMAGSTPYVMENVPKTCEKIAPIAAAGTLYPSLLTMLLVLAAQMFGRQ